jgi:hypothetical protein
MVAYCASFRRTLEGEHEDIEEDRRELGECRSGGSERTVMRAEN